MKKSAFTLIEILISIVLLVIIVIFLYQALDITTKSNKFFSQKLVLLKDKIKIKKIFFADVIYSESNAIKITPNKDNNSILQFKTSNTYHNSFYNHITYFISKESNLIRIESKIKFNTNKLYDDFFDTAYIDIIASNINKFKVIKKTEQQYSIYIIYKDKSKMLFTVKSMH